MRGTITLRVLAFAVASAMMVSVFAGCNSNERPGNHGDHDETDGGSFRYADFERDGGLHGIGRRGHRHDDPGGRDRENHDKGRKFSQHDDKGRREFAVGRKNDGDRHDHHHQKNAHDDQSAEPGTDQLLQKHD